MAENRYRDVKIRAKMERRYREHVYMYLELFPITAGRNGMGRPLPLAIPCSFLRVLGRARQRGVAEGLQGRGRAAPAAAPAVPGLGGQAAPAARGSGKMALPGSLPAFVAQFHPLSSPTGAILRSFLLSPRRVGRCRRSSSGHISVSWLGSVPALGFGSLSPKC